MMKMVKKEEPIPEHFKDDEEAGEFWDIHSAGDYWNDMEEVEMEFDVKRGVIGMTITNKYQYKHLVPNAYPGAYSGSRAPKHEKYPLTYCIYDSPQRYDDRGMLLCWDSEMKFWSMNYELPLIGGFDYQATIRNDDSHSERAALVLLDEFGLEDRAEDFAPAMLGYMSPDVLKQLKEGKSFDFRDLLPDLVQILRNWSVKGKRGPALQLARTERDEAATELINMVNDKLNDQLIAIEALGETKNLKALDYLLVLMVNTGTIHSREEDATQAVSETSYYHSVTKYYLGPAEFPNAKGKLGSNLGEAMYQYSSRQLSNDSMVLRYRSCLVSGHHSDAKNIIDSIYNKTRKYRVREIHSELMGMGHDCAEAFQHYFELYQILDLQTREELKKESNSYLIIDLAIRRAATTLARTRSEIIDQLIYIAEAGAKPSEKTYKEYYEKLHWWSRKKLIKESNTYTPHYNLYDQLIAIEALGETKSKYALEYLQNLRSNRKIENFGSIRIEFPNAKGELRNELTGGLYKTRTFEQSYDNKKGVFANNAYGILVSAIQKLEETTTDNYIYKSLYPKYAAHDKLDALEKGNMTYVTAYPFNDENYLLQWSRWNEWTISEIDPASVLFHSEFPPGDNLRNSDANSERAALVLLFRFKLVEMAKEFPPARLGYMSPDELITIGKGSLNKK